MSTKINVRSPYYLSYGEPVEPLPLFTCGYANPVNFNVDHNGGVSLPSLDYGIILGYTSTASDFASNKFAEVSSDTVRTVTLTIEAPEGFSNAGEGIQCDVSATQQAKAVSCSSVVTGGTLQAQTLAAGGASVTLDYAATFGGSSSNFTDLLYNSYSNFLDVSLNTTDEEITITSGTTPGVYDVYIDRIDIATGCSAIGSVEVTVSAPTVTYTCTDALLKGGAIAADGTLTTPLAKGTITATKETSGGASVTSVAANSSGAAISKTLFYDITVPSGFSNAGNTVECSKTYTQNSTIVTPTFTCDDIDFDDQAILIDGSVVAGVAKWHDAPDGRDDANFYLDITSFTPTTFDVVDSSVRRDVDYTVTVPPGFTNSGNSLTCTERVKQPAGEVIPTPVDPCAGHTNTWYIGVQTGYDYTTFTKKQHFAVRYPVKSTQILAPDGSWEGEYLCDNGNPINFGNGVHTYIRKTVNTSSTLQHEYVLIFGSGGVIKTVYFLDWNTKQLRRL